MLRNKFKLFCSMWLIIGLCCAKSPTDKDIDTQINMLYEKNPVLNEKNVHSKTNEQQVILKGCVRNKAEKELAADLAGLVEYIDSIDNRIKVNPKVQTAATHTKVSDVLINHLVHSKLMLNQSICAATIQVKTLNGITILSGSVPSVEQKKLAYKIALETKGVVDVINKLKINAG